VSSAVVEGAGVTLILPRAGSSARGEAALCRTTAEAEPLSLERGLQTGLTELERDALLDTVRAEIRKKHHDRQAEYYKEQDCCDLGGGGVRRRCRGRCALQQLVQLTGAATQTLYGSRPRHDRMAS
jgi:hypothetical protein